jgi:hypothetical protein
MSTLRRLTKQGPYGPQKHKPAHVVRRATRSNRFWPEFPISTLPLCKTLCLPRNGVKPGAPSIRCLTSSESLLSSCNTIGSRCRMFEISRSHLINRLVAAFFVRERSHDDAPTARSMPARGNAPGTCPSPCAALQGRSNRVCMRKSNLCGTRLQPRRKWSGFRTALQAAEKSGRLSF